MAALPVHPNLARDPESLDRARLLARTGMVLGALLSASCLHRTLTDPLPGPLLAAELVSILMFLALPVLVRFSPWPWVPAMVPVSAFLGIPALAAYLQGGIEVPGLAALPLAPVVATFFGGPFLGAFAGAVAVVEVGVFAYLDHIGFVFPGGPIPDIANARTNVLLLLIGIGWGCSLLYERQRLAKVAALHAEERRTAESKDRLISTVSHELRSPLAAVHGALQLLDHNVVGELPEEAAMLVHIALRNSTRLASLVDELLHFQALHTGALAIQVQPVRVKELLHELHDVPELPQPTLVSSAGSDAVVVLADPARFVAVWANLLSNARRHAPGSEVDIEVTDTRGWVRVAVSDRGPGLPPDVAADSLFEPFVQGSVGLDRAKEGAGLGLAIVRAVVEGCGGRVGAHDREGGGAVFWLELPEVA
ncbi:MAG: HAMP domain-containing histidine kinase [Deltaproteobacteria bacterium]|nr:MAG: HAMP domain-containing histidine kinase [Deltaproteobacteria bacterium]